MHAFMYSLRVQKRVDLQALLSSDFSASASLLLGTSLRLQRERDVHSAASSVDRHDCCKCVATVEDLALCWRLTTH